MGKTFSYSDKYAAKSYAQRGKGPGACELADLLQAGTEAKHSTHQPAAQRRALSRLYLEAARDTAGQIIGAGL